MNKVSCNQHFFLQIYCIVRYFLAVFDQLNLMQVENSLITLSLKCLYISQCLILANLCMHLHVHFCICLWKLGSPPSRVEINKILYDECVWQGIGWWWSWCFHTPSTTRLWSSPFFTKLSPDKILNCRRPKGVTDLLILELLAVAWKLLTLVVFS